MKIKAFIVDDEALVLDNLEYLLDAFPDISIVLRTTNVQEALDKVSELKPDIVFMDISMPAMSGLDFARRLYESNIRSYIAFVTAHDHYAIDAYAYNTIDYILKPVTMTKLRRTIQKLESMENADKAPAKKAPAKPVTTIMAMRNNRYYPVDFSAAQYIYTSNRKVQVVVNQQEYQLKNTFQYWVDTLKPLGWLRVHRSYLINLSQIETVMPMSNSVYYVTMKNSSEEIVVSRSFITDFRENIDI